MNSPARQLHVLISGASIAGPALAYWLTRYGFKVSIVEKAPTLRQGGYRVDIRGAAAEVTRKMGIADRIKEKATRLRGSSLINKRGRRIASFDPDLLGMRGEGDVEILRGDLATILYELTNSDTEYIFSDSITQMRECDKGVTVSFQHSAPRVFDLVIGADGLRSNVRRLAFGNDQVKVKDLGYYISIFSLPNYFHLDHWELAYTAPGRVINVFHCNGQQKARALFIFASPPLTIHHKDVRQQICLLTDRYKDAGWQALRLLASAEETEDFYFDSISQVHMESLSTGRVALVGDAGYCPSPASGQGTSLALVGAYVLAGELAKAKGNHNVAFWAYFVEMRPYIYLNQELGLEVLKQMIPSTAGEIRKQNFLFRILLRLPWKARIAKRFLRNMQKKVDLAATGICLKEYE